MEEALENNIKILNYYGYKKQKIVWIEEMSELTKELCKWERKGLTKELEEHIKEEITDVIICLDQLKNVLNYTDDELIKEYNFKVERQLERIKNGKD